MKLRHLLCLLLPTSHLLTLPLQAQDQQTSPPASNTVTPLHLQENPTAAPSAPASATTPAPTAAPSASDASNNSPNSTAASALLSGDSNTASTHVATNAAPIAQPAAAQPTPNEFVPGPAPTNGEPAAPAPNSGMGSPGQNPPPSDPNSLIPPPEEPLPPSPINTAGNEETQRQQQKSRYYSVKVKADKDEDLSSLLTQADKAKSDEVKRQALREYYDLLAKRMKKIDPSISDWIDTMHSAYLRRLDQARVEPTIPMSLPPAPVVSDEPSAKPSPTAPHTKKKKIEDADIIAPAKPTPTPTPAKSSPSAKPKARATPVAKPTPSPTATPAKKKHGIWPFLKSKPAPSPTPSPETKKKADSSNQ